MLILGNMLTNTEPGKERPMTPLVDAAQGLYRERSCASNRHVIAASSLRDFKRSLRPFISRDVIWRLLTVRVPCKLLVLVHPCHKHQRSPPNCRPVNGNAVATRPGLAALLNRHAPIRSSGSHVLGAYDVVLKDSAALVPIELPRSDDIPADDPTVRPPDSSGAVMKQQHPSSGLPRRSRNRRKHHSRASIRRAINDRGIFNRRMWGRTVASSDAIGAAVRPAVRHLAGPDSVPMPSQALITFLSLGPQIKCWRWGL